MAKLQLLEELETLTHKARMERMVQLGRKSMKDEPLRDIISELSQGSLYEQLLALATCWGSRNVQVAMELLSATSRHLQRRIMSCLALLATEEEFLTALKTVPERVQREAILSLRRLRPKRQRRSVTDAFLGFLAQERRESKLFRELILISGSDNLLDSHLPDLSNGFLTDWGLLVKGHPQIAVNEIGKWLDRGNKNNMPLLTSVGLVISRLSKWHADKSLKVARMALKIFKLSQISMQRLVAKRFEEIIDLIIETETSIDQYAYHPKLLQKLPISKLLALMRKFPKHMTERSFSFLSAEQRAALYELIRVDWRQKDETLPLQIVRLLPSGIRALEVRRHLTLSCFDAKPNQRIPFQALLPWDESIIIQMPFIQSSDVDTRSLALRTQIESAKYDNEHLSDALQLILKQKNDQDPVRQVMLESLQLIPTSRWKEVHCKELGQIIRNALDATDLSHGSIRNIQSLLAKIFSAHPKWSSRQMLLVKSERKSAHFPQKIHISGIVPVVKTMLVVAEEMSPFVQKLLKTQSTMELIQLAQAFDRYIRFWEELLDALRSSLEFCVPHYQGIILDHLKSAWPKKWSHTLLALKETDYFVSQTKLQYISIHRQDLLSTYLNNANLSKDDGDELCELRLGFARWTFNQQEIFAKLLLNELNNLEETVGRKVPYIKKLGELDFIGVEYLSKLANHEEPLLRETALRRLGYLDGEAGFSVLLDALRGDQARIAIYAIRRGCRSMSPAEVFKLLKDIPTKRVTVAKEKTRIIGELETEEAFQYLLALERTELHVDVRIALFTALWSYLDRDEVWDIYMRAAQNSDPAIAKAVYKLPTEIIRYRYDKQMMQLFLYLFSHPSPEVRIDAISYCVQLSIRDEDKVLVPSLLALMSSTLDFGTAAKALFRMYAPYEPELVAGLYRTLLADRAQLHRIHEIYKREATCEATYSTELDMTGTTHAVLSVLKEDRLCVKIRLHLILECLSWDYMKLHLMEIIPELHAEALIVAVNFIEKNQPARNREQLQKLELELMGSHDERARRLALSCLVGAVEGTRTRTWNDEQQGRLGLYRMDESVMVAERAWEVAVSRD